MSDANPAICKTLLIVNSLLYVLLDDVPTLFPYVQSVMALLSVLVLLISQRCMASHLSVIVVTGVLVVFPQLPTAKLFPLVPTLYLLSVGTVLAKLAGTLSVLGQSLWLLVSLAVCYYVFGIVGCRIFSRSNEYFESESVASLTFMQLSTLDNVGSIGTEGYKDRGFVVTFAFIVTTMLVIHAMLNLNLAFILAYTSDAHREHKALLDNNRNLLGRQVPLPMKVCRIGNVLASVAVLFVPFRQDLDWFYLAASLLSCAFILGEAAILARFLTVDMLVNAALLVAVLLCFLLRSPGLYLVATLRILLIDEVMQLFLKVCRCLRTISPLLSFTVFVYLSFSLYLYVAHKRTSDLQSIFTSLIEALQIVTLDDFTGILRKFDFVSSAVVLCMMVLLNHLLMNVLISEVFNAIEEEDMQNKLRVRNDDPEDEPDPKPPGEAPDLDEADKFRRIARELHYRPRC